MITRGNHTEHDEVYAFDWEVGKEIFFLLKERESGYDGRLSTAVQSGDISKVTDLLNSDTNINAKDNVGQTPLHKATDESIARLLIERGADINVKDNSGKTPFEIALEHHNIEVANFLANAKDKYGKTMLHYAAEDNNLNLVTLLINNGANIEAKGDRNVTPLYCSARDGYLEIARFLLDKSADANARAGIKVTAHDWTPLHTAAAHGKLDVVKLIIDKRDDIDVRGALSVVGKFSKKDSVEIRNLLEGRIRRNEENMQHLNLVRRKRHQHSQEEDSSLSIGVHNHLSIAKENEDSLKNDEIGVTSSATRTSSWINDLFGWVKSSIGGLLDSNPSTTTKSPISQVDVIMDVNSTIMLLDVLVRKVTGQKYISTLDQSISLLEAQGYALNITKRFEKLVEQAGLKSGVSMHRLNIDYMGMHREITRKVMSGKFTEISGILNSYVEKACPGREAGYPGKLNSKKFNKFMLEFNSRLSVVLNQSIYQILDKGNDKLGLEEQQVRLEPQSYLNNTFIQGHLNRDKVK